jgi:hypothetical protein
MGDGAIEKRLCRPFWAFVVGVALQRFRFVSPSACAFLPLRNYQFLSMNTKNRSNHSINVT